MQFAFRVFKINALFPTKQYGHMSQVDLIDTYQDDLHARLVYLKDQHHTIIHLSVDLLAFPAFLRDRLQYLLRQHFQNDDLILITSATHTHYGNDIREKKYQDYIIDLIMEQIHSLKINDYDQLDISFQSLPYQEIGLSRITHYESNLEYLTLIKIYHHDDVILHFIIHNTHPTVLNANVPYFSSEFCGNALKQLSKEDPNSNYTYCSGASGDISTRFTRKDQSYDSMLLLSNKLVHTIKKYSSQDVAKYPLELHYHEVQFNLEHQLDDIDCTHFDTHLHPRELLSLEYGKIIRKQTIENKDFIHSISISKLSLSYFDLIFIPNEIFSDYLKHLDLDHQMLISYSNGYGPYITPIDFPYITYEVFVDTLSVDCKKRLIECLKSI